MRVQRSTRAGVVALREAIRADRARNDSRDGMRTAMVIRLGQAARAGLGPWTPLAKVVHHVLDRLWCQLLFGVEVPSCVPIGPGLRLPHSARGLVVHPNASIGSRVTIHHGVTIGVAWGDAAPTIEDDVFIGVGAIVLGDVVVGRGARVGAGTVVVADVPAGATVVGVPARVVRSG